MARPVCGICRKTKARTPTAVWLCMRCDFPPKEAKQ